MIGSRRRPFQIVSVIDSAAGANVRFRAIATIHRRGHEGRFRVGLTRSTDDRRTAGFGAPPATPAIIGATYGRPDAREVPLGLHGFADFANYQLPELGLNDARSRKPYAAFLGET